MSNRKWINTFRWELEKRQVDLYYYKQRLLQGNDRDKSACPEFTIGIVTYVVRFEMFKALLKRMRNAFPHSRIVVAVNGYYQPDRQRAYLARMKAFTDSYSNFELIPHTRPQSLCKLWNELILASQTEKIFIVNDDIDIAPHFASALCTSGILEKQIAIINESWSHFLISKHTIAQVGWFDERLFGVGGEDWDYEARLAFAGVALDNFRLKGILNLSIYTSDFSFGASVERVEKKYTLSSARFLWRKWQICTPQDPLARYVRIWNNYVRLNDGFDTPVFYDFALLQNEKSRHRS